jgi:hypothetical protein
VVDTQEENYETEDPIVACKPEPWFKRLLNGPEVPRNEPVSRISWLSWLELLPDRFNASCSKTVRIVLYVLYLMFWFGLCWTWLNPVLFREPFASNDPNTPVYSIPCGGSDIWTGKNQQCGLNGENCPTVSEDHDIIIRCPALCNDAKAYSFVPLGDQLIKYQGFIIGGGSDIKNRIDDNQVSNPYRGDSYPCFAGIHAGLISPTYGGCARVSFNSKNQPSFSSAEGSLVGDSLEFLSFFKSSFYFKRNSEDKFVNCIDPRYPFTFVNILLGIPVVFLGSGAVAFWTLSVVGFWTIIVAMDPIITIDPADPENIPTMISIGAERFLPTCFMLYVLWHTSIKETLSQFGQQGDDGEVSYVTRVLMWYPLFWVGVLNNITFDRLPLDRFTFEDLFQRPGGVISMVCLIVFIGWCGLIQAYSIWAAGKFVKYLKIYLILLLGIIVLATIPGFSFHLHHYILAIILLPACGTKGRPAMMFSGLLLGLFISGASRWGLASIIETLSVWRRDDPLGNILPPDILSYDGNDGLLHFLSIPSGKKYNKIYEKYSAISLLVNDIEVFVGDKIKSINLKQLFASSTFQDLIPSTDSIPIYLRIGRKIPNTNAYSDFSRAATLQWPQGNITLPPAGIT